MGFGTSSVVLNTVVVENLHFKNAGVGFYATTSVQVRNCLFESNLTVSKLILLSGPSVVFEGCAFLALGGGAGVHSVRPGENSTTQFVSCTFFNTAVHGTAKNGSVINAAAYTPNVNVVFTNSILLDPNATSAKPSITTVTTGETINFTSNDYNVIQGLVNAGDYDANPAWKQPTDYYIDPALTEDILTLEDGIYKITYAAGLGKAYKHLPANIVISGVQFPEKDFAGNTINYAKATHSGAWQAVYLAPGESEPVELEPVDYTDGVFFVNEDWFGHQNSSVNFLTSGGDWVYNVYRRENPGKELGCTTQYGTIYGGKFYLVSKQAKDGGASIPGSRLAVADATTLVSEKEFEYIGQNENGASIADGRSFLGVDEHKGYIGSSNGIWLYDADAMEITGQLQATGSGNAGNLYSGQIGTMLRVGDRVFAVHQNKGLLVIDAQTDTLQRVIAAPLDGNSQRGLGSIVQSKDGNLWLSIAANTGGGGGTANYILKLNPCTLDTTRVALPAGYAVDIDGGQTEEVYDLAGYDDGSWGIYGAGFRVDPVTDNLYVSLFKAFGNPYYRTIKINPHTKAVETYLMDDHYWFPALPVFPDNAAPEVASTLTDVTVTGETRLYLGDKVSDADNLDAAIVKSILPGYDATLISVRVWRDSLIITPLREAEEETTLTLAFNSNGKVVTKDLVVTVQTATTGIHTATEAIRVYPNPFADYIVINTTTEGQAVIYDLSGKAVLSATVKAGNNRINTSSLLQGVYLLRQGLNTVKIVK
ncbi:MAG: hypothetical protein EZS26_000592 [Candidatus Ordinivivax streblomastigis]|uniref:Secretion system C-terminal sorting domain-containing protein n=1 Tax=Candidatus Ordinivivax streblomastigis TaxID=2540710 RepID=A0A5M8P3Z7_9BACT|nr:MAG: hypothetical protein EZS26_000375 [Candidatus Ordinivivax streblomastigis]KAA6303432.1 MAG: hypothetical protein EZS26_000592 [Candidatus Ordinivivax streblomastigis]